MDYRKQTTANLSLTRSQGSQRSTLLPYLLGIVGLLAALLPGHAPAQSSTDTPIKIRGGSMTFFSRQTWTATKGSATTFCTAIDPKDVGLLHLDRFFDPNAYDQGHRKDFDVPLTSSTWKLEIRGHRETESGALAVSNDGIVLQASPLDCNDQQSSLASVRISPLGKGRFYPSELLHAGKYKGDRRFASTCKIDRDRCERIAEIKVYEGSGVPKYTFACPDGECTVLLGKD